MPAARLILEDGTVYQGESFGATDNAIGEVVFNTSLTGYQEIATDPSYRFQIVTMTYPHIGNYGVEAVVDQSAAPQVAGFIVRDVIDEPSSAHSQMSLSDYFSRHRISAIQGIDTRALTRKIRTEGAMRGMITSQGERAVDDVVAEVRRAPSRSGSATSSASSRRSAAKSRSIPPKRRPRRFWAAATTAWFCPTDRAIRSR